MRLEQTICLRISISKRETSAKPHKTNKNNEKPIRTNKKHKKHNVKTKNTKNNNIFGPWSLYLQPIVPKYCFYLFFCFYIVFFGLLLVPIGFYWFFIVFGTRGRFPKGVCSREVSSARAQPRHAERDSALASLPPRTNISKWGADAKPQKTNKNNEKPIRTNRKPKTHM